MDNHVYKCILSLLHVSNFKSTLASRFTNLNDSCTLNVTHLSSHNNPIISLHSLNNSECDNPTSETNRSVDSEEASLLDQMFQQSTEGEDHD